MAHLSEEFLEELSDFQAWKSTSPTAATFSLYDYACCAGSPDLLWAFAEVLSPALVMRDGAYFIASRFSDSAYETWRSELERVSQVQRMMNHIHMRCLLQEGNVSDALALRSAELIAEVWSAQFADKGLVGLASGEDFWTAQVTLCQPDLDA